ncbi:MAG: hypothetical protein H6819_00275 [Phycisphaerales bacterium]|nr:hypothetical protein [Phycisphaerales bacterium]MCB9857356.1 hypothetical protein [Phycisphaerales bacterium]
MVRWHLLVRSFIFIGLGLAVLGARGLRAANPPIDFDDFVLQDDDKSPERKSNSAKDGEKEGPRVRWGQRRNESDEKYDKRYKKMMRRTKQDPKDDIHGGVITDGEKRIRLWTYKGPLFIVRTDIDKEFTVDTAMYMEKLHREYGEAYQKLLGIPVQMHEKVEVIVFSDRATYMRNGGTPGSGGFFHPIAVPANGDRSPQWPAQRFRLQQFTSGVTKFEKWEKGTLKHEAAHMELQMRLGYSLLPQINYAIPIQAPRWFNEGHASVFEYWDFDKTVDENFADIPNRGRYAPVIRRLHDTKQWKDFDYVWTIDAQTWHGDMTSDQGFFNYAQAWSLCAYMMNGGIAGKKDFRAVFDLSKRVGVDQENRKGVGKRAWELNFPPDRQKELEDNWNKWVSANVSRDKKVPDEEYFLRRMYYNPEVTRKLKKFETEEEQEANKEWLDKQNKKRKKSKKIEK